MKVKFLTVMAGAKTLFNTEDVYDLPTEKAERFIAKGICEAVEAKKPAVKKAPVKKAAKKKTVKK